MLPLSRTSTRISSRSFIRIYWAIMKLPLLVCMSGFMDILHLRKY